MNRLSIRAALLCLGLLYSIASPARLVIEITGGDEGGIPLAITPFIWSGAGAAPLDMTAVISADLSRSGRFDLLPVSKQPALPPPDAPANPDQPPLTTSAPDSEFRLADWKALGQEAVVTGRLEQDENGQMVVHFQLYDVFKGERLKDMTLTAKASGLRRVAHTISDIIYQALTGDKGAFTTRIAYVAVTGMDAGQRHYKLKVADADGYNPRTVVESKEPILSPAWSPDGEKLAYVSFESGQPTIFVQVMSSGQRQKVASFPGINSAPSWSPNGRELAVTLSKDGSPDIYILNPTSGQARRLTTNFAIDTEAVWSPDGEQIIFTSNRGGSPQLYAIPVTGGNAGRITFDGSYNAGAEVSPDGKWLAMVQGGGGKYRIALLERDSREVNILTTGGLDESPSFAPNGSMILYAAGDGLAVVSANGRVRQRLVSEKGELREPAWSPK